MKIQKPQLFLTIKSAIFTIALLVIIVCVRLFFSYENYKSLMDAPFYFSYGDVLSVQKKSSFGKEYTLIKFQSDSGFEAYIKTDDVVPPTFQRARFEIFPNQKITFLQYLGTFFVNGKLKGVVSSPKNLKDTIVEYIRNQHATNIMQSIYPAMFFGTPLAKEIRDKVIALGATHLIALSGFNLSILSGVFYFIFGLVYKPLQKRYFPYRYALVDIGLLSLVVLAVYVSFTDFSPSLIRAYAMVLLGWVLLISGVSLLNFSFLLIITLLLFVLHPNFLVSISFWLSVAGVFYIMLVAHHTGEFRKWIVGFVFIPLGVFLLMEPVVHAIFAQTSPYQLLSIPLEFAYTLFYPLTLFLHTIGYGGILDNYIIALLNFAPQKLTMSLFPPFLFLAYVGFSLAAVFSRVIFYFVVGFAFAYSLYLFAII